MPASLFLRVAIAAPLRRLFDYLPPPETPISALKPGIRLLVTFGRNQVVAVLIETRSETDVPAAKLKAAISVLDETPLLDSQELDWLQWISRYYHHPLGETIFTALPVLLRQVKTPHLKPELNWRCSSFSEPAPDGLKRAPKQAALYTALYSAGTEGLSEDELRERFPGYRSSLKALQEKDLVDSIARPNMQRKVAEGPALNDEQRAAVEAIYPATGFSCFLLNGVTGSGKTEVYLQLIAKKIAQNQQTLVLIPEIGLTPQLVDRFRARLGSRLALLHSGLSDSERLRAWQHATQGRADVVIGTRSAVFTGLPRLGLIIVDEEHDGSYKQQDGLRYHARDLAISRAHRQACTIVLGSATPSFESLANVQNKRYQQINLHARAGNARPPKIELMDVRGQKMTDNLAENLIERARRHLAKEHQVLIFLNRRGFSPTLICHDCGWLEHCGRCDSHMTLHKGARRLRCHHCGAERALPRQCPSCSNLDLKPQGFGTERLEQTLSELFPDHPVIRIDRDTTRGKGKLDALLESVREGQGQILLGTQMLAKGHDFPNVTLVGILDADQGLFSSDFRASERLAQLVTQVAGRAGRGNKPGHVVIQTHHPDNPLLHHLIAEGYNAFAAAALRERQEAGLPPHHFAALVRAEAVTSQVPLNFLGEIATNCPQHEDVQLLGPVPCLMERRAGRYRAQLLLLSENRASLHQTVQHLLNVIAANKEARRVRWSIDIDPQDLT